MMRKVMQTRFGKPGGNCQQAALASLLELPLDEVPDFCNEHPSTWDQDMNRWLYDRGLFALYVTAEAFMDSTLEWMSDNVPCIAVVDSKITPGAKHAVIFHKGKVIHDPHPSGAHLSDCEPVGFDLLLAIRPEQVASMRKVAV